VEIGVAEVGIVGGGLTAFGLLVMGLLRLGWSLGRLSKGLEWNNQAMEKLIDKTGSMPPRLPRPKLVTLDDPWAVIEKEARDRENTDRGR
jgi:hypothetical protein